MLLALGTIKGPGSNYSRPNRSVNADGCAAGYFGSLAFTWSLWMNSPLPNQSTQAIAVFAACFAKTMGEKDPEFINSFQKNLEEMYYQMRDNSYFPPETLQAVRLTGDLLKT